MTKRKAIIAAVFVAILLLVPYLCRVSLPWRVGYIAGQFPAGWRADGYNMTGFFESGLFDKLSFRALDLTEQQPGRSLRLAFGDVDISAQGATVEDLRMAGATVFDSEDRSVRCVFAEEIDIREQKWYRVSYHFTNGRLQEVSISTGLTWEGRQHGPLKADMPLLPMVHLYEEGTSRSLAFPCRGRELDAFFGPRTSETFYGRSEGVTIKRN